MRILLINHFPLQGSGSGIYTLNIAKELHEAGLKVCVIDIDNRPIITEQPFLQRRILCDASQNDDPDLPFNFPCFTTHPRSDTTFYQLSPAQIAQYVHTLVRVTQEVTAEFHPDVIHAQHLWITPYAAHQTGIPYVITCHGTDLMGYRKDPRYHRFAQDAASHAAAIITISKQVDTDVKTLFRQRNDKIHLIPNGFDENIFRILPQDAAQLKSLLGLPTRGQLISFVGKFTSFKGIDILLKAMETVQKRVPDVHLALAGDGELREEMEELVRTSDLQNIHFLGQQEQEQVAQLYNCADISVVPSRIEPFGLVALEAMACGTPVVATDAGGLPDFVNAQVGALVPMENPDALAEAIIAELRENTKLTKGKVAAAYALKTYSWKRSLQKVIDLYTFATAPLL